MVSAHAGEGLFLIEIEGIGAGVGVDAVEDDLHALGMGGIAEGLEILLGTQHGVRGLVVAGVIAVAGKALADGIQVQDRSTQGSNVVHLLRDAPEIAAVEIIVQHLAVGSGTPGDLLIPILMDSVGLQLSGEIEEAAIIQDVPWIKRMTRIIIPIQKSSIISGYLLPFMTCLRELSLFMLLCGQGLVLATTLDYFDEMGLYAFSSGINLILIITILVSQALVNKVTGASLDKGIGG